MENEILLEIICHGALLPADRVRSSHFVERPERGESQNFTKEAGRVCLHRSGRVRSMLSCNRTEFAPPAGRMLMFVNPEKETLHSALLSFQWMPSVPWAT